MALTGRMWGAGKLLLLGGALFLTYVLFAAAAMRVALKSREVVVPSLAGKTVNDATAVLSQSGLNLRVEESTKTRSEGSSRTDSRRRILRLVRARVVNEV